MRSSLRICFVLDLAAALKHQSSMERRQLIQVIGLFFFFLYVGFAVLIYVSIVVYFLNMNFVSGFDFGEEEDLDMADSSQKFRMKEAASELLAGPLKPSTNVYAKRSVALPGDFI
jgi:hypothetical protein